MNAKTLKALRGSIRKWERIVDGTGADEGPNNCSLCFVFFYNNCYGCPVNKDGEHKDCSNTPYDIYSANPTKENAQRELDFLISLLPPGVSKDA